MKLSEAIREGAKLRPQCRGDLFKWRNHCWFSCALGVGLEGLGISPPDEGEDWDWKGEGQAPYEILYRHFPFLYLNKPEQEGDWSPLMRELVERNDEEGQTREQIADWLEAQGY